MRKFRLAALAALALIGLASAFTMASNWMQDSQDKRLKDEG